MTVSRRNVSIIPSGIGGILRCALVGAPLLFVGGVTACNAGDQLAPDAAVRITITPTSIVAPVDTVHGLPGIRFALDATIHNDGAESIYLASTPCVSPVQHLGVAGWSPAVGDIVCTLMATLPTEIPAGTTLVRHVSVAATLTPPPFTGVWQWLPGSVDGVYRVELPLTDADHALLSERSRTSPSFTITE